MIGAFRPVFCKSNVRWSIAIQESVPHFVPEPPDKKFVLEGQDVNLEWSYTLDGTLVFARFSNVTAGGRMIASRTGGGATSEPTNKRFRADLSDSQTRLTNSWCARIRT